MTSRDIEESSHFPERFGRKAEKYRNDCDSLLALRRIIGKTVKLFKDMILENFTLYWI